MSYEVDMLIREVSNLRYDLSKWETGVLLRDIREELKALNEHLTTLEKVLAK